MELWAHLSNCWINFRSTIMIPLIDIRWLDNCLCWGPVPKLISHGFFHIVFLKDLLAVFVLSKQTMDMANPLCWGPYYRIEAQLHPWSRTLLPCTICCSLSASNSQKPESQEILKNDILYDGGLPHRALYSTFSISPPYGKLYSIKTVAWLYKAVWGRAEGSSWRRDDKVPFHKLSCIRMILNPTQYHVPELSIWSPYGYRHPNKSASGLMDSYVVFLSPVYMGDLDCVGCFPHGVSNIVM